MSGFESNFTRGDQAQLAPHAVAGTYPPDEQPAN
jgi:hypothetical protein